MSFEPHSQVGQDRFAWEVTGRCWAGSYVDIGCGDPVSGSNSYGLEKAGWYGLLVDRYDDANRRSTRLGRCIVADAVTVDWHREIGKLSYTLLPPSDIPIISYLSLDCDENSLGVLRVLPLDIFRFAAITIEHDKYRLGPAQQDGQREMLKSHGYDLVCADVMWEGNRFEDWWVLPGAVDQAKVDLFRCEGVNGLDIVARV